MNAIRCKFRPVEQNKNVDIWRDKHEFGITGSGFLCRISV